MTGPRRLPRPGWGELLLTSGLAALIATVGSLATDSAKSARDMELRRCEIALAVLSDETPNPYMDERTRTQVVRTAFAAFDVCMKEKR